MRMRFQLPTHSQHDTRRKGGQAPPLRQRSEEAGANDGSSCTVDPPARALPPMPLPESRRKRHMALLVFVTMFSVPAYFFASRFIVTAVVVQGRSMSPTLKDGERYYLNRWRYL